MVLKYTDLMLNSTTSSPVAQIEDKCPYCGIAIIEHDVFDGWEKYPRLECKKCGGIYTYSDDSQNLVKWVKGRHSK